MKRLLIAVLSALMLFTLAVPSYAAEDLTEDDTAGNVAGDNSNEDDPTGDDATEAVDVVGYSDSRVTVKDFTNVKRMSEFDAKNTEVTEYVIGSTDDWKKFASLSMLNTFNGMTIYLGCDLDFTDVTGVTPIGIGGGAVQLVTPFAGTFDGQGYTIDHLTLDAGVTKDQESGYWGLFALLKGGTIKNLILGENCTVSNLGKTHLRVGGIVGAVQAEAGESAVIDNCWNKAAVTGNRFVGGIAGHIFVSEKNALKNDGITKVTQEEKAAAYEVVGHVISNCTNSGAVHAITDNVGGIAGHVGIRCDIINCRNTGKITADALTSGKSVGGIAGMFNPRATTELSTSHVTGCINNGEVVGVGAGAAGGICGLVQGGNSEISGCHNYGSVSNETNGAKVKMIIGSVSQSDKYVVKDNVEHEATDTDATLEAALAADSTISGTSSTLPEEKTVDPTPTPTPSGEDSKEQETVPEPSIPDTPSTPSAATDDSSATETDAASSDKKGCASVVSGVPVILLAAVAGFAFTKKRKK